jgi:hypothetical protein
MSGAPVIMVPTPDRWAQQDLAKVIRNASRTIALVGFPNSGKTSYLVGLGKVLRSPQVSGRWRIVGSSQDIFQHVQELLRFEQRGESWEATDPRMAPKPLNLFTAKRKGLLHWQTSAFDTSGEHYLAMAGGLEMQDSTPAAQHAETLRREVLPKCPGILALIDCSLGPNALAEQVNLYCSLLNRVHGFAYDQATMVGRLRPGAGREGVRRIPVAVAVTKVDLLDGVEVRLRADECAYLKYVRSRGRSPADAGIADADSPVVGYTIRTAVFLDRQKHPDPAEAQAVLEDFVCFRMRALAEMVANMRLSDLYDVRLFPVSAWGKRLDQNQLGVEVRPSMEDIDPARILDPMFWLMEKVHHTRVQKIVKRTLKVAAWAVAAVLALGPGLFWALYGAARYFQGSGSLGAAATMATLAGKHPYARFVQRYWEPRSQRKLAALDFAVATALRRAGDVEGSRSLAAEAKDLGVDSRDVDDLEAEMMEDALTEAEKKAPPPAEAWEIGKSLLAVQARRGPAAFSKSVVDMCRILGAARLGADLRDDLERTARSDPSLLSAEARRRLTRAVAASFLHQATAKRDLSGSSVIELEHLQHLARQADRNARQSGEPDVMAQCRTALVAVNEALVRRRLAEANAVLGAGQIDTAMRNWDSALQAAQESPALAGDLRGRSEDLARKFRDFGKAAKDKPEVWFRALECSYVVWKEIAAPRDVLSPLAGELCPPLVAQIERLGPEPADRVKGRAMLVRLHEMWRDCQPPAPELAQEMSTGLSRLLEAGKLDADGLQGLQMGWAVLSRLLQHYQTKAAWDAALAVLPVCLGDPNVPRDDAMKRIVSLVGAMKSQLAEGAGEEPALAARCRALSRAADLARTAGAGKLDAEVKDLAALECLASLALVDVLSRDPANRVKAQELLKRAADLWRQEKLASSPWAQNVEARLQKLLDEGKIALETLGDFSLTWKVCLELFKKSLPPDYDKARKRPQDFDQAMKYLQTALADPAFPKDQARACLAEPLNLIKQAFYQGPPDPNTCRAWLDRIAADANRAGQAELSKEAGLLNRHLDRVGGMALVKRVAGDPATAFYIDKAEVTVGQYRDFLTELGSEAGKFDPNYAGIGEDCRFDEPNYFSAYQYNGRKDLVDQSPVIGVSCVHARKYAEFHGKRLPRRDELEFLAGRIDPNKVDPKKLNIQKAQTKVAPARNQEFSDDAWGEVVGIVGNVREWCDDRKAPPGKAAVFGLSWFDPITYDWRQVEWESPDYRDHHTGFRCAVNVLPEGVAPPTAPATSQPVPGPR